jgi:hypothetical protein
MWEPAGWEPAGRSSFIHMQPPEDADPDNTDVAPEHPAVYAREQHPDRIAALAAFEAEDSN